MGQRGVTGLFPDTTDTADGDRVAGDFRDNSPEKWQPLHQSFSGDKRREYTWHCGYRANLLTNNANPARNNAEADFRALPDHGMRRKLRG